LLPGQTSYIPEENVPLRGLGQVNVEFWCGSWHGGVSRRRSPPSIWIRPSSKAGSKQAQPTYQGGRGYQPMLAVWAEMNLIVSDQFRDGNVPAQQEPLEAARRAFRS